MKRLGQRWYLTCQRTSSRMCFPHYAIDVSLRDAVDRVYRKVLSQSKSPNPPIFLVTEEYETIPATQFANGECFLIDEWRNGKALIEGGREG